MFTVCRLLAVLEEKKHIQTFKISLFLHWTTLLPFKDRDENVSLSSEKSDLTQKDNSSKDNRVNKSLKGIIAGAVSDDDDVLVDLTDYFEGLQRSSSCSSFTIKRQKKQSYEIVDLWIPTMRERDSSQDELVRIRKIIHIN